MRAITLHDPWATLVAIEAKRFETRDWKPDRADFWMAIHASKNTDHAVALYVDPFKSILYREGITRFADFHPGYVLALAYLSQVHRTETIRRSGLSAEELAFGDYSDGRFAWEFSKVIRLPKPVPARGYQKIWNWEPEDEPSRALIRSLSHPEFSQSP